MSKFFSRSSDPSPTWNDIPFNENDTPQQKADQFDAQIKENAEKAEEKRNA